MTSTRRLHLTAAFAVVSVGLAVTSTVSALASPGAPVADPRPVLAAATVVPSPSDPRPVVAPRATPATTPAVSAATAVPATPTPSATPTPTVARAKAASTSTRVSAAPRTARPAATRAPARKSAPAATAKATTPRAITISSYVDAPGSQAAIDQCHLVLWMHAPLWLAGHNYCGFQWMAFVPTGTTVRVTSGAAAGTFVVTGHLRLTRQGGAVPLAALKADLVLQTCVGSGTGLTFLRRA